MLYVVAGNGTGPAKEITSALKDLKDKATKEDAEFWIVLEGKDEPTQTDNAILKWLAQNETWFEVYTANGTTYDNAQETHQADDVFEAMLERIRERQADNEDAAVLVLLTDDEDEDAPVQGLVEQAIDADVAVYALNGEMAQITLEDDAAPAEEAPAAPTKAASKKAAAPTKAATAPTKKAATKAAGATKKAAAAAVEAEAEADDPGEIVGEDVADEAVVYSHEELMKMTNAELGAVARSQGLDPKGAGKKDLIVAIEGAIAKRSEVAEATANGVVLVVIHLPGSVIVKHVPEVDALALAAQ